MFRKAQLLAFTFIASVVMAMDGEQVTDTVTATSSVDAIAETMIPCADTMILCAQHTLVSLSPAEDCPITCEELAPPAEPLITFISKILDAVVPGTYTDMFDQIWNVSEYDAFAAFVGNRGDYVLSSDSVRPEGVYTYPEMGMISVIYDFVKDNDSDQFFSLELTRIPEEYRIAREQENAEYRAMRAMQDAEYQELLARDREFGAEQAELVAMDVEDALSRLCFSRPPRVVTPSPLPLTREQLRAQRVQRFVMGKDDGDL